MRHKTSVERPRLALSSRPGIAPSREQTPRDLPPGGGRPPGIAKFGEKRPVPPGPEKKQIPPGGGKPPKK